MFQVLRFSGPLAVAIASAAMFLSFRKISYTYPNDEAQIRALEGRFAEAFRAKNIDKIMENYEHSPNLIVFDVVPRLEYRGWDAYKGDWREFFASIDGPITSFEVKDLTINVEGNLAYGHSFQRHLAKTKSGAAQDLTARVTDVYRKIAGKWLIVQEHISVPVDLRTGKADLQSAP